MNCPRCQGKLENREFPNQKEYVCENCGDTYTAEDLEIWKKMEGNAL